MVQEMPGGDAEGNAAAKHSGGGLIVLKHKMQIATSTAVWKVTRDWQAETLQQRTKTCEYRVHRRMREESAENLFSKVTANVSKLEKSVTQTDYKLP